jgi:hypothetical protein
MRPVTEPCGGMPHVAGLASIGAAHAHHPEDGGDDPEDRRDREEDDEHRQHDRVDADHQRRGSGTVPRGSGDGAIERIGYDGHDPPCLRCPP